ncbi:hypothetical protein K439DRAFT_430400 [Ramaria rubella]|nr:hypothetical protein K439DRAFT_430400 [Ramaria rubella]
MPSVVFAGANSLHLSLPIMDTSSSTYSSTENISIITMLFPPKLSIRSRSLSNATLASSRSGTPAPSIAPSTPHFPHLSTSQSPFEQPIIIQVFPRLTEHLEARDILSLSQTSRRCRDLRTSHTFQRHLTLNGWDTGALIRRTEEIKETQGRPWLFLARSALDKDDILKRYALLPKGNKKKGHKKDRLAVEKFMRILMDAVTEHGEYLHSAISLSTYRFYRLP